MTDLLRGTPDVGPQLRDLDALRVFVGLIGETDDEREHATDGDGPSDNDTRSDDNELAEQMVRHDRTPFEGILHASTLREAA